MKLKDINIDTLSYEEGRKLFKKLNKRLDWIERFMFGVALGICIPACLGMLGLVIWEQAAPPSISWLPIFLLVLLFVAVVAVLVFVLVERSRKKKYTKMCEQLKMKFGQGVVNY